MTDSSSNGRVYHRAAPTQGTSRQKKSRDAACEASNQAEGHGSRSEGGRGFCPSQTELEVENREIRGEQLPFPQSERHTHPKVQRSHLGVDTPSLCSRQETPGCRQEKGSRSSKTWNFHLLSAASTHRGQTRLGGAALSLQTSTYYTSSSLNNAFKCLI